jgi:hypothetical protein
MVKGLANDRRYASVLPGLHSTSVRRRGRGAGHQYLVAELRSEATGAARNAEPPGDLSTVIATPSSLVEPTIPLEPAVGIHIGDPTRGLNTVE